MPDATCPRCQGPTEPNRDLTRFRCHACETEFMQNWPPAGLSDESDLEWYRQCWQSARLKFLDER